MIQEQGVQLVNINCSMTEVCSRIPALTRGQREAMLFEQNNLLAIVENRLSNFNCKTRGTIEAVIRGICRGACVRLERDVRSNGRRRVGQRGRRTWLRCRPTRTTL